MDFRSPSIRQIADFFLHLFQEKNVRPSTIDSYRSAFLDKMGNAALNISKDENLEPLVHQLTKLPFEPHQKGFFEAFYF